MTDTSPLDEDAVAEIPPGEPKAGSVQGGGSRIADGDTAASDAPAASRLDDVPVEIVDVPVEVDKDKGATGE